MKYLPLILLLIGCGETSQDKDSIPSPTFINRPVLFKDSNFTYRIPSLLAFENKLLVFANKLEGDASDTNDSTIVIKQLEPEERLLSEIDPGSGVLGIAGAPQPIYDNGKIHLFFNPRPSGTNAASICETARLVGIRYTFSVNDGLTWSVPVDLTDELYELTEARNLIISPTSGFAKDGNLYLVVYKTDSESDCNNRIHLEDQSMVLKYDGARWSIHSKAIKKSNESAYDLETNTFWARFYLGNYTRLMQIGPTPFYLSNIMPAVHSGMIIHEGKTYVSYPASTTRQNLVFHSLSSGPKVIHTFAAAYSNIAFYKNNFAIVYESGAGSPYDNISITFVKEEDANE